LERLRSKLPSCQWWRSVWDIAGRENRLRGIERRATIAADAKIDATLEMHLQTSGHAVEPNLTFAFDLARHETAPPDRANDCGHTVWQPRAIANPYGGAMSSIMVPVCVPTP